MVVHNGWLYASTFNSCVFLTYTSEERWPQELRDLVRSRGRENLIADFGGFDLWRTRDGVNWVPVTRSGFGNRYNYGGRTLVSTQQGLFLGTANPFAPQVAVETTRGWRYVPNPRGGMEIWRGSSAETTGESAGHRRPGRPYSHLPRSLVRARLQPSYDALIMEQDRRLFGDFVDEFYEGSNFFNAGLWDGRTRRPVEACMNLMEYLLACIPGRDGSILDVGCGKGGTTRYLTRDWPPEAVTGINISERQLAAARIFAPRCRFLNMDAARMRFPDASFATIVCVEAAFQFNTREAFLQEAWRVLEPGGYLLLADLVFCDASDDSGIGHHPLNALPGRLGYARLIGQAGFEVLSLEDATEQCWRPYVSYSARFARRKLAKGEAISVGTPDPDTARLLMGSKGPSRYILAAARKPAGLRPLF
jgi:MPBQ/MSBQ methyltransferase